jgi:glycosyltransferase involved in cell wall biosynthesis
VKNILHLYSNYKWTGPADHALNLVSWLNALPDISTSLACSRRKGGKNFLLEKARKRQIDAIEGLLLNKHLNWKIIPDVFALKKIISDRRIDVIHSHQDNDTLTALLAGFGDRLVRTIYDGEPTPLSIRQRLIYRNTPILLTASRRTQENLSKIYPHKHIEQVDIPVDSKFFRPLHRDEKLCREFGIASRDPVVGIVARAQKHRNFELLLEAIELMVPKIPKLKFLIVGRGTHIDTVAGQPVKNRGLQNTVIFTGYRNEDYHEVLNLFDCKIFLTPGSDGSCRAAREALACGIPVVAAHRGILPELIDDGKTGIVVDDNPSDLSRAVTTLINSDDLRRKYSRAARRYAETVLAPQRYVDKVLACYSRLGMNNKSD